MNIHDYTQIPDYMMESINEYVKNGCPMGHFLTAVFSNDLFKSFGRADEQNTFLLPVYVSYIYNECPLGCHGSMEIVENWIKKRTERLEPLGPDKQ
jgi:hypothetical protein